MASSRIEAIVAHRLSRRKKRLTKVERPCGFCGQPFLPKQIGSMYCGRKCGWADRAKNRPRPFPGIEHIALPPLRRCRDCQHTLVTDLARKRGICRPCAALRVVSAELKETAKVQKRLRRQKDGWTVYERATPPPEVIG